MDNNEKPWRVLHVVSSMNRGGIETWLIHLLHNINRELFNIDIMIHTTEKGDYDDEASALGVRIIRCSSPRQPFSYLINVKKILREYGPYDVIHCHLFRIGALVLYQAYSVGVPVRIMHSHCSSSVLTKKQFLRRFYACVMRYITNRYATDLLAVSLIAGSFVFGKQHVADPRFQVLHPGINLEPFVESVDRIQARASVGIPTDAKIVGHIGSFSPPKNHRFFLKIASLIYQQRQDVWFLLIGDGPLRPDIEVQIEKNGLSNRFIFAGVRTDVVQLIKGAMDVLLFPSLFEGFPLVVQEAQAAGLPIVMSDVITEEVDVVKSLIHRLSLDERPEIWAKAILSLLDTKPAKTPPEALTIMKGSSLNIQKNVRALEKIYLDALKRQTFAFMAI